MDSLERDTKFGGVDSEDSIYGPLRTEDIPGDVIRDVQDSRELLCGRPKGIQGHQNSCYIDSVLFSMFAFSTTFDNFIAVEKRLPKNDNVRQAKSIMREGIVNPLRK